MRTRAQVKQQLKQVTYRHLQRLLRENFKRRPSNCQHNYEMQLDDETVSLCGYLDEQGRPRNIVCDDRSSDCVEMAKGCPLWAPLFTRDEIKDNFNVLIHSERGVIASEYPDIAALIWVMDDETAESLPTQEQLSVVVAAAENAKYPEPPKSWWGNFKKRFGGS